MKQILPTSLLLGVLICMQWALLGLVHSPQELLRRVAVSYSDWTCRSSVLVRSSALSFHSAGVLGSAALLLGAVPRDLFSAPGRGERLMPVRGTGMCVFVRAVNLRMAGV